MLAWRARNHDGHVDVAINIPDELAFLDHVLEEALELVGLANALLQMVHLLLHLLELLHLLVDGLLLDPCFLLLLHDLGFRASSL